MFWLNIKRIFRTGLISFFRNTFVSLSAVLIMTITLFVLAGIVFSSALLNKSLDEIKNKVDVNVYFLPTTPEDTVLLVKKKLESLPEVGSVQYVSKEQALENFRFRHKNDQKILEALNEFDQSPLGAILNVKAKETSQYQSIALFLEQNYPTNLPESVVYDVNYNQNKDTIQKLSEMIEAGEKLGGIIAIIFILISILITFNTIRLTMHLSRDEIKVMKLVGASGAYISGPFVVAGVVYGIFASIVTLIILYPITYWLGPTTERFFSGVNVFNYYLSSFGQIFIIIFFSGILIGSVSSFFAIKKYLREQRKKG